MEILCTVCTIFCKLKTALQNKIYWLKKQKTTSMPPLCKTLLGIRSFPTFMSKALHVSVLTRWNFLDQTLNFHHSPSKQGIALAWNTLSCFPPLENFYSFFKSQLKCQHLAIPFQTTRWGSCLFPSAPMLFLSMKYFKSAVYMLASFICL